MRSILSYFIIRRRLTLLLAITWTAFILFACFIPGDDVPKVRIFEVDKLVHVALFGLCSFLWGLSMKNYKRSFAFWLWVFVACVGLGILVELIQSTRWIHGRTGDFWDVVADTVGVLLGLRFVKYVLNFWEHRQ